MYISDSNGLLSTSDLPTAITTTDEVEKEVVPMTSEGEGEKGAEQGEVDEGVYNKYAGYLLRVKPIYSDEGGIASGYSVASSPSLV